MIFRIIGDTIELDGLPVATIHPSVWPTRRDYLEQALEAYDPDSDKSLNELVAELEEQLADAKRDNETLRDEKEALENQMDAMEREQ